MHNPLALPAKTISSKSFKVCLCHQARYGIAYSFFPFMTHNHDLWPIKYIVLFQNSDCSFLSYSKVFPFDHDKVTSKTVEHTDVSKLYILPPNVTLALNTQTRTAQVHVHNLYIHAKSCRFVVSNFKISCKTKLCKDLKQVAPTV